MTPPVTATTPSAYIALTDPPSDSPAEPDLVAEDLVEEVSIDGMCGVY